MTNEDQIGLVWNDGASAGGTPVIDYRITYDQSVGTYVTLVDSLTTKSYTTAVTLIQGRIYKFKVEARNTVGYSLESTELSVLAA